MTLFRKASLQLKFSLLFILTIVTALCCTLFFYIKSFHSMQSERNDYAQNIVSNLVQHTEDFASTVRLMAETIANATYTSSFLTTQNTSRRLEYQQYLNRIVSKLVDSSPHISDILLIDNEENVHSFSFFNYSLAAKLNQQYQIFSTDMYSEGFSDALYLSDSSTAYTVYIQPIYDDIAATDKKQIGTCLIICSLEELKHIYANVPFSERSLFAVLDSENQILTGSQDKDIAVQLLSDSDHDTHIILQRNFPTLTNWNLVCTIPFSELYSEMAGLKQLALLLIIVVILSFLLLRHYISLSIISPLVNIVSFLQNDSFYVLHNNLKVKGCKEIDALSTSINQMLTQLNEMSHTILQNQAQMYEVKLSKKQAQLSALQTQINPHFIFNTLNAIKGLSYQNDWEGINLSVDSLSYIMRYNLNTNNMTLVKDEFLCIENYLSIIEFRFPKRFVFHLNMDPEIEKYEMPRFILQPLVENAISHGLEPNDEKGTLTLSASLQDNDTLHFECTDDGVGISPDKIEELKQKFNANSIVYDSQTENHSGIGLVNINMRIRLIYGEPYGLSIHSGPKGTTVCADFPAKIPM